jgi:hypothetical protein
MPSPSVPRKQNGSRGKAPAGAPTNFPFTLPHELAARQPPAAIRKPAGTASPSSRSCASTATRAPLSDTVENPYMLAILGMSKATAGRSSACISAQSRSSANGQLHRNRACCHTGSSGRYKRRSLAISGRRKPPQAQHELHPRAPSLHGRVAFVVEGPGCWLTTRLLVLLPRRRHDLVRTKVERVPGGAGRRRRELRPEPCHPLDLRGVTRKRATPSGGTLAWITPSRDTRLRSPVQRLASS